MSRVEVPSYRFSEGELELVASVQSSQEGITVEGDEIDARSLEDGQTLAIALEVTVPKDLLEHVLPSDQVEDPPVEVFIVENSDRGRRRTVHTAKGEVPGTASFLWQRDHSKMFGETTLTPVLVRASKTAHPPFAGHIMAVLADGEALTVSVDARPPDGGRYLETEYQAFGEGGTNGSIEELKAFSDLMYYLDTSDDARAVLYLNSEIEALRGIMDAPERRRGKDQRIKDATFAMITAQVWPQLVERSLSLLTAQLAEEDIDAGTGVAIAYIPVWARQAVEFLSFKLYDEAALSDCVGSFEQDLVDDRIEISERIDKLIEELVEPVSAFRGLVKWKLDQP